MIDALLAIDRAIAGTCPCGANPAPGSAYCGDDCTPTHRSIHSTAETDGTQMRWRPDLVSEHDDSRLSLSTRFRRGQYTATVYEITGSDGVHCRLDDGNRFVGQDADGYQFVLDKGLEPVWQRLERELGNSRHLELDDGPSADAFVAAMLALVPTHPGRLCVHCGERTTPQRGRRAAPLAEPTLSDLLDNPFLTRMTSDAEPCDLCGNCGWYFPGPPLVVTKNPDGTAWLFRLDRCEVRLQRSWRGLTEADFDLTQEEFDRAELRVITDWALRNPGRVDVEEWWEARTARQSRLERAGQLYRQTAYLSAQINDPRNLLRGISMA